MVRIMVQLTEEQLKALKALAKARKTPVAKLVRESVAHYVVTQKSILENEKHHRAQAIMELAGKYHDVEGKTDISENHDEYLEDIYSS